LKQVGRLVLSSRPLSWVNTAFPFAAAYFFEGGEVGLELVLISLFFLIPYNFLMYGINDVYDYESDLRNPRKGGIEGALLPPELHRTTLLWAFGLSLPPAVLILITQLDNFAASAVFLLTMFAVVAYSIKGLRFKELPFVDSVTSSIHFVGPMLFGLLAAGANLDSLLITATGAFFIWGAASHAFGAVQDVRADREAGISSIATALGARATVRLAFFLYLIAGALLLTMPDRFVFSALAALPYLFVTLREWSITDENCERANRGWRLFLLWNFLAGALITSLLIGPM
jgi:4-hydroxybenzoate polyprenyltransferase